MVLPILIIFCSFCMTQGMEDTQKSIIIKTLKNSFTVFYNNNTTITDIKKCLEQSEGIPVNQQKLLAFVPSTDWYFEPVANFMGTKSDALENDAKISELIEWYGPSISLELYLQSHKNPYKND